MITIATILKNPVSQERFMMEYEDKDIKWINILDLEQLQEEIGIADYNLIILDSRIWWLEKCKELLKMSNASIVKFEGDFSYTFEDLNKQIGEIEKILEAQEKIENGVDSTKVISKEVIKPPIPPKVIVKEVPVEKIVYKYKTKDIRKSIYTVLSSDNNVVRDYYSLNLGAVLSSLKNNKSIVIDITFLQNIKNYLTIEKERITKVTKEINSATIQNCMDKIAGLENVMLLRVGSVVSKSLIKTILFNLRDYENIIFVVDMENENIPINYILALAHQVHLILEPTYPSINNSLTEVNTLKDLGQVEENIKVIFTELNDMEGDVIKEIYKNKLDITFLRREVFLDAINQNTIKNKVIAEIKAVLGIRKTNLFNIIGRRR